MIIDNRDHDLEDVISSLVVTEDYCNWLLHPAQTKNGYPQKIKKAENLRQEEFFFPFFLNCIVRARKRKKEERRCVFYEREGFYL